MLLCALSFGIAARVLVSVSLSVSWNNLICSSVRLRLVSAASFWQSESIAAWSTVSGMSRSSGILMVTGVSTPSTVRVIVTFVDPATPSAPSVFVTSPSLLRSASQLTAPAFPFT